MEQADHSGGLLAGIGRRLVSSQQVDTGVADTPIVYSYAKAGRTIARLGLLDGDESPADGDVDRVVRSIAQSAGARATVIFEAFVRYAEQPCGKRPFCGKCDLSDLCKHYAGRPPTLKDLPEDQRPRERMAEAGPDALNDAELLAILIGSGRREVSAVDLSQRLLNQFGGLRGLSERAIAELCSVEGIGLAKATRILAGLCLARRLSSEFLKRGVSFRGSQQVFDYFHPKLRSEKQEKFLAVLLDAKNRIIRWVQISSGGLTGSAVNPRDVLRHALVESASAVIFVHNHPSGDPAPSRDDLAVTQRLVKAGEIMGIRVLDHVIIGDETYTSLADQGQMR